MADKAEEFKKANAQESQVQSRDTADGKKEFLDEVTNEWVSKSELKKRQTSRKKAEQAAKKAEEKKAKEEAKKAEGGGEKKKKVVDPNAQLVVLQRTNPGATTMARQAAQALLRGATMQTQIRRPQPARLPCPKRVGICR